MDFAKTGSFQITNPKYVTKANFFEKTNQELGKHVSTPRQRSTLASLFPSLAQWVPAKGYAVLLPHG